VILGAAEGPAFPVPCTRSTNGLTTAGAPYPRASWPSGAAFAPESSHRSVTWIIERYGWHSAFGVLSLAGLAWAILWMVVVEKVRRYGSGR